MKIYLVMGSTVESSWVQAGYFDLEDARKEVVMLQLLEDKESDRIYYLAPLDVKGNLNEL